MKVLFVALGIYGGEGGIERFNRRFIQALAELGHDATVLALWDPQEPSIQVPGVTHIGGRRRKLFTAVAFTRILMRWRPDVVILGHILLAPLLAIGRLVHRTAAQILIVHGVEAWSSPSGLQRRLVCRGTDLIAAVSRHTVARMASTYALEEHLFRLLANAVDVRPPVCPAVLEGTHRLLSVARLERACADKNIGVVIAALPAVLKVFPDAHYYIVGDGDLRPALEAQARALGVADRTHFLGAVGDAVRDSLYAASDLFVLPSTREGFGIVFLEAWMRHVAVIASDQSACPEVVRHGIDGLCVPPDAGRLADAMIELLGDERKRRAMAAHGYERVCATYSHERFRETLGDILSESRKIAR